MTSPQDLIGEAGRPRAECDFILRSLGELEILASNVPYMHEGEHDEITAANHNYSRSSRENLQRASPTELTSA
jgi:hypothetical protein